MGETGVEAGWGQGRGFHGSGLLSGEEEKYSRHGGYRILFSGEVVGILVLVGRYIERWGLKKERGGGKWTDACGEVLRESGF